MLTGELVRLDHDAVSAAIAMQPGALAELDQHRKMGLLPGVVFWDVMPGHAARVARFAAPGKPRGLVAGPRHFTYILGMKTERDVIKRLGRPDEIVGREDRMRSRSWLCSTCRTVSTNAEPLPCPAPCVKCGGIFFETVESPPQ
jgi:hypothetical protein